MGQKGVLAIGIRASSTSMNARTEYAGLTLTCDVCQSTAETEESQSDVQLLRLKDGEYQSECRRDLAKSVSSTLSPSLLKRTYGGCAKDP